MISTSGSGQRIRRVTIAVSRCLGAVFVVVLLSSFTPLVNRIARSERVESHPGPADAIVVLGGGLNADGTLSVASLYRVTEGIRLYQKHLAPLILFSGPGLREDLTEAGVAAGLARDCGVLGKHILTNSRGKTTWEETRLINDLLKQHGIRRILLVTESEHLRRALPLFVGAGLEELPAPSDPLPSAADSPEARLQLLRRVARELVGRVYYALRSS
jgi:uncharacterized SAM-binding protein YcdF (DUF218 family)